MIISHKLKVIFIKPFKVAGTSFQAALSKYCGENDIVCFSEDYEKRNLEELQKFKTSFNDISFDEHASATVVKEIVPKDIWDNYLKISIIRCPYDTHISAYWYRNKNINGKYFSLWTLCTRPSIFFINCENLSIGKRLAVDFLIRYEHLDEDIKKLEMKIGCPGLLETFNNISEKADFRPPEKNIYTVYSKCPIVRSLINKKCEKNIKNELIAKYFPLYREKLSRKVPEPGCFSVFVADLLYKFFVLGIKKSSKTRIKKVFGLRWTIN